MGYVNRCVCSATKVPGRAANCPDTTVSFLGLGGLSAGERREDRGWERGNWDVPGISLHIWEGGWGGCLQREGAGLKREAGWLVDSGTSQGRKGGATTPGDWQMSGLIFKAVSSPLSKAFLMSFTSTWDPDTRKIPSCCSPRKTGNSDQGDKKANSQQQHQA